MTVLSIVSQSNLVESISDNLLISLIILLLFLFVLAVIVFIIRRWLRNPSDLLVKSLREYESLSILMHENPDPDAMSSAMGLRKIAEENGVETEILYPGLISHDENRAFRTILDVNFRNIERPEDIKYNKIALVDHHRVRGLENGEDIIPDIVIDHHNVESSNIEALSDFWHIDDGVSACASIISQFMIELGMIKQQDDGDSVTKICTGLYHGIKSDTNNLSRNVSDTDFESINVLYEHVDEEMLFRIANPKISTESIETKARAITNREKRKSFCVTDVDTVENPDSIPRCADEIVNIEGISCAVVLGDYRDEIRLSGRSYDDRVHIGTVFRRMTDEIGGNGGGHPRMAGATISEDELDLSRRELIDRVFDGMSKY